MHTINHNGKTIKTNLGEHYSLCNGDDKKTMRLFIKDNIHELDTAMFERLASYGYTRITFYYTTTNVRGLYDLVAYCK